MKINKYIFGMLGLTILAGGCRDGKVDFNSLGAPQANSVAPVDTGTPPPPPSEGTTSPTLTTEESFAVHGSLLIPEGVPVHPLAENPDLRPISFANNCTIARDNISLRSLLMLGRTEQLVRESIDPGPDRTPENASRVVIDGLESVFVAEDSALERLGLASAKELDQTQACVFFPRRLNYNESVRSHIQDFFKVSIADKGQRLIFDPTNKLRRDELGRPIGRTEAPMEFVWDQGGYWRWPASAAMPNLRVHQLPDRGYLLVSGRIPNRNDIFVPLAILSREDTPWSMEYWPTSVVPATLAIPSDRASEFNIGTFDYSKGEGFGNEAYWLRPLGERGQLFAIGAVKRFRSSSGQWRTIKSVDHIMYKPYAYQKVGIHNPYSASLAADPFAHPEHLYSRIYSFPSAGPSSAKADRYDSSLAGDWVMALARKHHLINSGYSVYGSQSKVWIVGAVGLERLVRAVMPAFLVERVFKGFSYGSSLYTNVYTPTSFWASSQYASLERAETQQVSVKDISDRDNPKVMVSLEIPNIYPMLNRE